MAYSVWHIGGDSLLWFTVFPFSRQKSYAKAAKKSQSAQSHYFAICHLPFAICQKKGRIEIQPANCPISYEKPS